MEQDIDYKGYRIKIRQDESCESPDDWGNTDMFLVYDHRQFYVKRDNFNPSDIIDWLDIKRKLDCPVSGDEEQGELEDELKGYFDYSDYYIYPVYAYIHSGVSLSLGRSSYPFTCPWDTSMSGFLLVKKEEVASFEVAEINAESLIETWNDYLSGDVWGFIVEEPTTIYSIEKTLFDKHLLDGTTIKDLRKDFMEDHEWEEVDSCWGFYGEDACIEEAKAVIDNLVKNG